MQRRRLAAGAMMFIGSCLADAAQAQLFTPTFSSPRLINDVGLYLSDGPGNLAVETIWRRGLLGFRVGYLDAADGLGSIAGELRNPISIADIPLDLAVTAGVQGVIGAQSAAGIQAGLSAGSTWVQPGIALSPYLHPRLAALNELGEERVAARALADVGVDAELWNGINLRFGVSLSDIGARWGVGGALRR